MAYRILSLDGGGTWALIQVHALMALYSPNTTGHEVLSDFNLVAANSGGSLVLGGLVENVTLVELCSYFEDEAKRKSLFSPTTSWGDRWLHDLTGFGPKYSSEHKLPAIETLLPNRGNIPLPAAAAGVRRSGYAEDVHLLIVGFDYDRNCARFFRSSPASGPSWGQGGTSTLTLAEAIHASTNAPVNYFDAPATFPDQPLLGPRYWDGAVTGCNNPILAAVTEAVVKGQTPDDIVALSLGTGTVSLPWPTPDAPHPPYVRTIQAPGPEGAGLVADLHKLATAILDDPPDISSFLAHVMTGGGSGLPGSAKSRIIRMNPLISPLGGPGAWRPPGPDNAHMTAGQFRYLVNLDMDAVEPAQVAAISSLAELWLQGYARNQPIRMHGDTLELELGDAWFHDAAEAWRALKNL